MNRRNIFSNKKKNQNKAERKAAKNLNLPKVNVHPKENHKNKNKFTLEPQAGATDFVRNHLPAPYSLSAGQIAAEVGAAMALFTALYDCVNKRQALAVLYLYFEKRCPMELFSQVAEYLRETIDVDILSCQEGLVDHAEDEDEEVPAWLATVKDLRSNWKTAVGNSAFKQVSTLLSMAAALGLCDISDLKFDVNGIRIFSIPTYKKHLTAFDFADAAVDTVLYFVEGGYKCFKQGSLRPFIFSGDEARSFDKAYFELIDLAPFMKTGTMESKKGVCENDFDLKLTRAIERSENLYHAAEGSFEKGVIYAKLVKLRSIRADFISVRCDGKLREAPYGFYIYGAPGVGKSTVSSVIMRTLLLVNGFDASDDRIITLNESDRFEPTYRGYINGVHIDDWGQTLPAFAQKSPVEKIFEFVNNVPAYANMPEADLKGKIPKVPKVIGATGNLTAHRVAKKYTESAPAAVRRFLAHVEVRVKEEFAFEDGRLDSSKVFDKYGAQSPPIPDLWELDLYVPDMKAQEGVVIKEESITLPVLLDWLINNSQKHFANQRRVVEYSANLDKKLDLCHFCMRPDQLCTCVNKRSKDILAGEFEIELENQSLEDMKIRVRQLLNEAAFYSRPWMRWTNYVPECCFDNHYFDMALAYLNRYEIFQSTLDSYQRFRCGIFLSIITTLASGWAALVLTFWTSLVYMRQLLMRKRQIISELRDMNGAMPELFRNIRDNHVKNIAVAGSILAILYTMVKMYRASRTLNAQGNLQPKSMADIKARDEEVNPWAGVVVRPPKATAKCKTVGNMTEAINAIGPNVSYFELTDEVSTRFTNVFAWKGNLLLIPGHIWRDDTAMGKLWRYGKANVNATCFSSYLNRFEKAAQVAPDLYMIEFDNVQLFRDLTHLISPEKHRTTPAVMLYRNAQGELTQTKIYAKRQTVTTSAAKFDGYIYDVPEGTFQGLCMAPIVSDTVSRQVVGFHLGGKGRVGGAIAISRDMLEQAEIELYKKIGTLPTPAAGVVLTEQYGKQFYLGPTVDPKSPTNYLNPDNVMEHYGTVTGRMTAHSTVIPTPISKVVEEVTGVPNTWGPPKFKGPDGRSSWHPWRESLLFSTKPSVGVEPELLAGAIQDYEMPLLNLVRGTELGTTIRPLTDMQTVCGKDGERFIDRMKGSTSAGFPLSGPKSQYIVELDPALHPDFNSPAELDPAIWEEAYKMRENYRNGVSNHSIFKACLKDEPTPRNKDKVRVFQAAPIALQLLIRQYFLPVARVLSLYPLVSECAVGLNAQGPEWEELREHVTKYGEDRILAGDYSKYDLRMPAQLIRAAFKVLIDIARATGNYTEDDLLVMSGIAAEVAYPTMAYNGDLIGLVGSNPSGQNLTVYINSIVNSLLFRCGWLYVCKTKITPRVNFRKVVALITYGDDAKGSVKKGWDEFNHISYANFLSERDMKFTMPDKTSDPVAFMNDSDADFLKRKNVYNDRVNLTMGALDENSIFKSLHSVLHSTAVSPREVAAMNIDGALREWFAHGEEVYEFRRQQMKEVAAKCDLTHMCQTLDHDYTTALLGFSEKYNVPILEQQAGEYMRHEREMAEISKDYVQRNENRDVKFSKRFKQAQRRVRLFEERFDIVLEPQSAVFDDPPFMSEEHQLNYVTGYMTEHGFTCAGHNIPAFGDACVGEIDALYESFCNVTHKKVFVVVEAKMGKNRSKGIYQLGKYGLALAILQPTAHILTVLVTGRRIEPIGSFNGSAYPMPIELQL